MNILGESLGSVASYAIVNIFGGETLMPLYGVKNNDNNLEVERLVPEDCDITAPPMEKYNGNPSDAVDRGINLLESNPNDNDFGVLVLEKTLDTNSGPLNSLCCIGIRYKKPAARAMILLPYKHKDTESNFEIYMPVPHEVMPTDSDVDALMNGFLAGLKSDQQGWSILQNHFIQNGRLF